MKQVDMVHYCSNYGTKKRFASFWHQIDETLKTNPKKILEIGKGSGFFSSYLQTNGFDVTTLDFAEDLNPDVVASVLDIPLSDNSFDTVTCCQVLEHLPFDEFSLALREIARVAKSNIIISLPQFTMGWYYAIHIPYFGRYEFMIEIPSLIKKKHKFDGQHYWEIGKKDYPLKRITEEFDKTGLELINTYRVLQNPYHRFFILKQLDV